MTSLVNLTRPPFYPVPNPCNSCWRHRYTTAIPCFTLNEALFLCHKCAHLHLLPKPFKWLMTDLKFYHFFKKIETIRKTLTYNYLPPELVELVIKFYLP